MTPVSGFTDGFVLLPFSGVLLFPLLSGLLAIFISEIPAFDRASLTASIIPRLE